MNVTSALLCNCDIEIGSLTALAISGFETNPNILLQIWGITHVHCQSLICKQQNLYKVSVDSIETPECTVRQRSPQLAGETRKERVFNLYGRFFVAHFITCSKEITATINA